MSEFASGLNPDNQEWSVSEDDARQILSEVERFCDKTIAPLVARPELPINSDNLTSITHDALNNGLLNLSHKNSIGLWDNINSPVMVSLSCKMLVLLAKTNAGIAYHFHQKAITAWLLRELGISKSKVSSDKHDVLPVISSLQGHYGLGRHALPRYLLGKDKKEDHKVLEDYFSPVDPRTYSVIYTQDSWQQLLTPFFENGCLSWRLFHRDELLVQKQLANHGLDELDGFHWRYLRQGVDKNNPVLIQDEKGALLANAMQIQALGLMSIALGSVQRACRLAKNYASIRKQGGVPINRHPAVQLLLGNIISALNNAWLPLEALSQKTIQRQTLPLIMALRAQLHTQLCQAANDALQIFGGNGYMRDTGLEKIVRDNNQLRLMNGTPSELLLLVSEWERLQ